MYETEKWLVYEHGDFLEDLETIVGLIKKLDAPRQIPLFASGRFDGIYGIPAGGLVPAVYLHHRVELPLLLAPTNRTIVFDDIVDSGSSISHYIKKGNFTISLFFKVECQFKPNIWLREKSTKWVLFPWENNEEYEGAVLPKGRRGIVCPTGEMNS